MARYKLLRDARQDIKEIYQYVFVRNPSAAKELRELFYAKFRMLAANPLLGEKREDLEKNLRMFTAGNYVILYRMVSSGIEIVQVVHSARDLRVLWLDD